MIKHVAFGNGISLVCLTGGEQLEGLPGAPLPGCPRRVAALADGAQSQEAEEQRVQEPPLRFQEVEDHGRKQEEHCRYGEGQQAGVEQRRPGVGHPPVGLEVADRAVGEMGQQEVGEAGKEEEGEGNAQGAVEYTEELGLLGDRGEEVVTWRREGEGERERGKKQKASC